MKFIITVNLDNASLQGQEGILELERILHGLTESLKDGPYWEIKKLLDVNGNTVGRATLEN